MDMFKEIYETIENLLKSGVTSYKIATAVGMTPPAIERMKKDPEYIKKMKICNAEKLYKYAKELN